MKKYVATLLFPLIVVLASSEESSNFNFRQWNSRGGQSVMTRWMNQHDESVLCSVLGEVDIEESCSKSIEAFCEALQIPEPWAEEMLDSTAKSPDGVLGGKLYHLGAFDECLLTETNSDHTATPFTGKYCLAEYSRAYSEISNPTSNPIWIWLQQLEENLLGALNRRKAVLQTAWCIPSTCSNEDLRDLLVHLVDDSYINVEVPVNKCQTADYPSMKAVDIVALVILLTVVLLVILSTGYDVITTPKASLPLLQPVDQRSKICLIFSVRQNWNGIFAEYNKKCIKCINGLRALSIGWVVLGHTLLYYNSDVPSTNVKHQLENSQFTRYMGFANAHLAADTFLLISGFLISYKFFEMVTKTEDLNIFKYYIHRYIRVTPALATMVLLSASLLNHAGSGPLWYSTHHTPSENCKNNWWSALLFVNNYVYPNYRCLPQSWYLSIDMQLFWLSPIVLIPLWKTPHVAKYWIGFLLLVGVATPFTLVYVMDIKAGNILLLPEEESQKWRNSYYETAYTRFPSWVIGIVLGYIIYHSAGVKENMKTKLSWKAVALGWLLAAALMLTSIYSLHPFQQWRYTDTTKTERLDAAFYLALHRPAWSFGVAWVLYACSQGYGGFVNTILSWRVFEPISRLSYGIFLTNVSVINLLIGVARTPNKISDFSTIQSFWIIFSMSLVWAIPLVLLFEFPFLQMEKVISGEEDPAENEVLPELPPKLKSPVLFKKPSSMFALPEMIQIGDDAERFVNDYSMNIEPKSKRKPVFQQNILGSVENNSEIDESDFPQTLRKNFDTRNHRPEKVTSFKDLSNIQTWTIDADQGEGDKQERTQVSSTKDLSGTEPIYDIPKPQNVSVTNSGGLEDSSINHLESDNRPDKTQDNEFQHDAISQFDVRL